jgi:SpoVK/Ycf46/Vps4 family AAA+-type ATPase
MAMFRSYTAPLHIDSSIGAGDLAKIAEGYSGSDVRDMCQAVQLRVVSELFESGMAVDKLAQPRPIVLNDFKEVLKVRRPSVSLEMLRAYANWSEQFKAL